MADKVVAGSWVRIHQNILAAGERAPQVPEDTARVPLELRVCGFLIADGVVGEEVEIETLIGRRIRGILEDPDPGYTHDFGRPLPELLHIGQDLWSMMGEEVDGQNGHRQNPGR